MTSNSSIDPFALARGNAITGQVVSRSVNGHSLTAAIFPRLVSGDYWVALNGDQANQKDITVVEGAVVELEFGPDTPRTS